MSVTIVLPIFNRALFTLRWLWHANRTGFPFPIIIADGGNNPRVREIVEKSDTFPNLSIEYFRRPDTNHSEYMKKCAIAVEKAKTPYVMFMDDDDFILPSTLTLAGQFLDENPDYVGAGGATCGLLVSGDSPQGALFGNSSKVESWHIMYDIVDLDDEAPGDRIKHHMGRYQPTFYYVYRKAALQRAFQSCASSKMRFMPLFEIAHSLDLLISGKLKGLHGRASYVRQLETSEFHSIVRSWHENYIHKDWIPEFNSVLNFLGTYLDGKTPSVETQDFLKDCFATFFRSYHDGTLFRNSPYGSLDKTMALMVNELGASQEDAQVLHKELTQIEETLEGSGYADFIDEHAPDLC